MTSIGGCLAGTRDDSPQGVLAFENRHRLPHTLGVRVVDAPRTSTVDGQSRSRRLAQRFLHASASMRPEERLVVEDTCTAPVGYTVSFTVDGRAPAGENTGQSVFDPSDGGGRNLASLVDQSGDARWQLASAE